MSMYKYFGGPGTLPDQPGHNYGGFINMKNNPKR